jgi:hypothetical protein
MNHQNVATILVGKGGLPAHRLESDHPELAEDRRVVCRSSPSPHNVSQLILACRRVSVTQQCGAGGVPMFARREVVGPATHRKRSCYRPAGVILQDQSSDAIAVRPENNFNREHERLPLLAF